MSNKEKKMKCIWCKDKNDYCEGEVKKVSVFVSQDSELKVPMCERHFDKHNNIFFLAKNGYNATELLDSTFDYIKREALTLKLSIDIESE